MSFNTAQAAFHALTNAPAFVDGAFVAQASGEAGRLQPSVVAALQMLATAAPTEEMTRAETRRREIAASYGGTVAGPSEKPFIFFDGTAVIPVHGLLINRFPYSWGFVTGYNFIRDQHRAARQDPDVRLIVLDVNCWGGMKAGAEETARDLYDSRAEKPTIAMVDYACFSAAYYVASAAAKVVCTPSGYVGSIGALCMRPDYSKALQDAGIALNVVYAGEYKVDSHPAVPFTDEMRARYQAEVDLCRDEFVAAVVRNRGMTTDAVLATKAGVFDAAAALKIGLIDSIAMPDAAVEAAVADLASGEDPEAEDDEAPDDTQEQTQEHPAMTTPTDANETQLSEARTTAANEAKARISAILSCEDAKDRPALARHLAFETEMSADAAMGMLKVAGKETQAAAPPANQGNQFDTSMDNARQPNIKAEGGEGGQGGDDPDMKAAQAILAAQDAATGTSYTAKTKH